MDKDQKIAELKKEIERFNIPFSVRPLKVGEAVYIDEIDYTLVNSIFGKSFDVDYNVYTRSAFITTKENRAKLNKLSHDTCYLTDLFYLLLREGKTPEEAKTAQKLYAIKNNMLEAFNKIYQ